MYPRGVTTLEIVMSMAILAIIFSIAATGISRLQRTSANISSDHDIMGALTLAARRARSGRDNTSWGVYIPYNETSRLTTSLVVFSGTSYAARDTNKDITLSVNEHILFTAVDFSGSSPDVTNSHEIIFAQYSGATAQYGSLTLEWYGVENTIAIDAHGVPVAP
ncbi:MAG: hypothetical protein NUV56_01170 [Candidatus Uhrbacteria bacterium]|nr:hypothetical protein [Candidatus Uhrbacteria bacterium]